MQTYSIRPERQAHALLGVSAGGFGAMAIALKHRDVFGAVATLAGPLNMRYDNCAGRYGDDFDPATYRERTDYDPDMIIARFYFGLLRRQREDVPRTGLRHRARHDRQGLPRQPGRPPLVDRPPPRRAGHLRQLPRRATTTTSTPRTSPSPGSPRDAASSPRRELRPRGHLDLSMTGSSEPTPASQRLGAALRRRAASGSGSPAPPAVRGTGCQPTQSHRHPPDEIAPCGHHRFSPRDPA